MKTDEEKREVPSFDDLVFDNRNKEYGAYIIRKKYDAALLWSIVVSVFFISASVITPFIIEKGKPIQIVKSKDPKEVILISSDIPLIDVPKNELPKPNVEKIIPLDYSKPEIVDSISDEDAKKFKTNDELNETIKNDSVIEYKPEIKRVEIDPDIKDKINDEFSVNEKPFFGNGGKNEFQGWISQNIIYPESAIETNTQGKVYLQFVIEPDGSISNIQVIRSIDTELSKEAIRVLELSPKWNPGKIDGTPVRVKIFFPITFTLKNN